MTEEFTPPPRTEAQHRMLYEVSQAEPGTFGRALKFTVRRVLPRHPHQFCQDGRRMMGVRHTKMRELDQLWLFDYGRPVSASMYALRPLSLSPKGEQVLAAWNEAHGVPVLAETESR